MEFYVYAYLDPRRRGSYVYGAYKFEYEPFYIGKGKGNRKYAHASNAKHLTDVFSHKLNKIRKIQGLGLEPLIVEVKQFSDESGAYEFEQVLIEQIGRSCKGTGPLTNVVPGGKGSCSGEENPMYGRTHTDKVKKILSKCASERRGAKNGRYGKHNSEETKQKFKLAVAGMFTGENNPMYGRHHTEASKEKMSSSRKGKHTGSANHNYGKPLPESTKKKISEAKQGKKHPECFKVTMQKASAKYRYFLTSPTGTEVVVNGLGELDRMVPEAGLDLSGLRRAIKDGRPYKGWTGYRVVLAKDWYKNNSKEDDHD